jgi:hypothetical protein
MKIDEGSQITVLLDREVRETVERVAKREDRTLAAQVRHFLNKALVAEGLRSAA